MEKRRAGAFTLIELLVVVAIIAVLIAMLLPAIQQARQEAYMASCGAQLKMIGVAMMMYAEDNHGWFPRNYIGQPGDSNPGNAFAYDLQPFNLTYLFTKAVCNPGQQKYGVDSSLRQANTYLSPFIFYCPATKGKPELFSCEKDWQNWDPGAPYGAVCYTSYCYFGNIEWLWYWQINNGGFSPQRNTHERLAEGVLFMDTVEMWHEYDRSMNISKNHQILKSANILYGDGHVGRKAAGDCKVRYMSHLPGLGW